MYLYAKQFIEKLQEMLKIKSLCTTLIGGKIYKINGRTIIEEKLISEGAYSYVYMAKDLNTNKIFALKKTICQDKEQLKMTNKEITILKSLPPHKNIVQYYGSTVIDENNYKVVLMLMEFCERGNLLHIFEKNKEKIREIHIIKIMKDVMCGLNFLHVQEIPIIHRDIKLENILCDAKGVYKICDFGSHSKSKPIYPNDLSKTALSALKEEIERDTTLMYRPPELIDLYANFEISTKIDIWMMGCVLYLLLFHVHPFQDNSFLTILNCSYKIPSGVKISKRILSVLIMMLSKDPEKRIDSTTLLYIFENYIDLKKWIIHVSNDIKKKVNIVFEKREESKAENKSNKNIEINNDRVLESKIGNEEYQNQLLSNSNTMPLRVVRKGLFFSHIGKGGEKKELEKKEKEKETNKSLGKEEKSEENKEETTNNTVTNTNSNNNDNDKENNDKENNNSIIEEEEKKNNINDSAILNNDIKPNYSKTLIELQEDTKESNSYLHENFGKTISFSNEKNKQNVGVLVQDQQQKKEIESEGKSTSTDNLIKLYAEKEENSLTHSNYALTKGISNKSNINSDHNIMLDLNGPLNVMGTNDTCKHSNNINNNNSSNDINEDISNNKNKDKGEIKDKLKLIDLTYEQTINTKEITKTNIISNDIQFPSDNKNSFDNDTVRRTYGNAKTFNVNENEKIQQQKNNVDTVDLFSGTPYMFSDVSDNEENTNLMDLDDYFWENGEKNKNFIHNEEMIITEKENVDNSFHIHDNNNNNNKNTYNNISSNDITKINYTKTSCYDVSVHKSDDNFGNCFDPWNNVSGVSNVYNENKLNDNVVKNGKEQFIKHENNCFLLDDISFSSHGNFDAFKKEENDYNKLNYDNMFFYSNLNYEHNNTIVSGSGNMWSQSSCNDKNSEPYIKDIKVKNDINDKNITYSNLESCNNANDIYKNWFEKKEKEKKYTFDDSLEYQKENENDEHNSFSFQFQMSGKNTKNKQVQLIKSDKNDKFSELLDEFQKISSS